MKLPRNNQKPQIEGQTMQMPKVKQSKRTNNNLLNTIQNKKENIEQHEPNQNRWWTQVTDFP